MNQTKDRLKSPHLYIFFECTAVRLHLVTELVFRVGGVFSRVEVGDEVGAACFTGRGRHVLRASADSRLGLLFPGAFEYYVRLVI